MARTEPSPEYLRALAALEESTRQLDHAEELLRNVNAIRSRLEVAARLPLWPRWWTVAVVAAGSMCWAYYGEFAAPRAAGFVLTNLLAMQAGWSLTNHFHIRRLLRGP